MLLNAVPIPDTIVLPKVLNAVVADDKALPKALHTVVANELKALPAPLIAVPIDVIILNPL